MKKLSKIQESVWGDLHSRGIGETEREEDDVNLLDLEGLCDYLNKIYKSSGSKSICVQNFKPDTELCVSLYEDIDGYCRFLFYNKSVVNTQRDVLYELKCNKEIQQKYSLKQLKNDFGVETVDIYPKDGSPVNNEFFLEVLEFFLENIKEPYTKLIEKIEDVKESVWGDLHKRGIGELEREEDKIGNIKDMIPVDMGVSVLWSDRDLEVDDNCYFSFDEANELIEKSGWRLPTREEAEELCVSVRIERNTDKICIVYREDKPDVQLTFKKCGQKYGDNDDKIYRKDTYNTWTSTAQGTEAYRIFKISSLIFGTNFQMHKNNKICVRLVKDKPNDIKESVWGDLHKRGVGELEREEDDIGNLSELKPLDMGLSVLWADKDLEVDGDYLFNFEETNELIEKSEWRLPTLKEVSELNLLYNTGKYFYDDKSFYFENNGNKLIFYRKGFQYISAYGRKPKNIDEYYYYCWTSDIYDSDCIHILSFDDKKIYHSPVNNRRVTDQIIQRKNDELCVRLVKNKKRED